MFRRLQIFPQVTRRFCESKSANSKKLPQTLATPLLYCSRLVHHGAASKDLSCSFSLLGVLAAGCFTWSGHQKVRAEELQQTALSCHLSAEEKMAVEAMCEELMEVLVRYVDERDEFWQDRQVWKDPAGEIVIRAAAVAGFSTRVFMASTRIDGVTLAEIALSVESYPGCRKERWDPVIEKFCQSWRFDSKAFEPVQPGTPQPWIALVQTYTQPVLMGLISKRTVDDICLGICKVPRGSRDGQRARYIHAGIGVKSPHAENALVKRGFQEAGEGMALLHRLRANSVSQSHVVMTDYSSGIVVEDLGNGSFQVNYIIHSDPAGGLPVWMTDKSVPQSEAAFLKLMRKDIQAQRSEKANM